MGKFFTPNITGAGRFIRGLCGAVMFISGVILAWRVNYGLGTVVFLAGCFTLYEAVRGWCLLRACGIKTKF
jgi:hypothetical protein